MRFQIEQFRIQKSEIKIQKYKIRNMNVPNESGGAAERRLRPIVVWDRKVVR